MKPFSQINTANSALARGVKNASYMSAGSLISQFFGLIAVIFLARLFGPKDYGIYTTVIAFVTFFHLFIFGGLSKAIIREGSKEIEPLHQILEATIGIRLLFILLAIIVCIGATFFTNYSNFIKVLIIIYCSEIIYDGIDSFIRAIYQIIEKMQYLAYFSVLTRALVTGLSIAFLYMGAGVLIILIVNLLCKFAVLFVNFLCSRKFVKFNVGFNFRVASPIVKAMFIFSLIQFINILAVKIDILMISFLSTSTDVGIYAIAHEIAREGLMLRNIIAIAFFPVAVKYFMAKEMKIRNLFIYSFSLFVVVILGCLVVTFFAKDLVVLIFGTEYMFSGNILKILIFYLSFAFFSLPFTIFLQATHREHLLVIVCGLTALLNIPLNIIFFSKFGLVGIAYSTIIVFFSQALLVAILTYRSANNYQISI